MKTIHLKGVSISTQAPDMSLLAKEVKKGFEPLKRTNQSGNTDRYALGLVKIKR